MGDIAGVLLNGQAGWRLRLGTPYVLRIDRCQPGRNQLEVRVTNSIANFYEGVQTRSGLLGMVRIRATA